MLRRTNVYMLETLRAEMVEKGMRLGFLHPEVIAKSEELDKLLNKINKGVKASEEAIR